MTAREALTPQQYDPLGALGSRPLAIVLSFGCVVWAGFAFAVTRDAARHPDLVGLGVLLVAAAATVVTVASSPYRAPFSRRAYAWIVALHCLAIIATVAGTWGFDREPTGDAMAVIAAISVLVSASYRPCRDLVVGGATLAVVLATAFGAQRLAFPTQAPLPLIMFLVAAPTLVLTVGATVFARTFAELAERVQIRAGSYSVARAERDGIAESIRQDRSRVLSNDAAPFLAELRTRGTITDADRERARAIADDIRGIMVADADRTWLVRALAVDGSGGPRVDDPDGLASVLDIDGRTVVRTLLRAVMRSPAIDTNGITVSVRRTGSGDRVELSFSAPTSDTATSIRKAFGPYLAVLRVSFPDLEVAIGSSSLGLRFSYDQH